MDDPLEMARPGPLDVAAVRAQFPALADPVAYFDGPGGSQVPTVVGRAVADTLTTGISNRGVITVAERRADDVVTGARQAIADLSGGSAGGVVFGRSMTQLTYDFARTLARGWTTGDEVVVTRLDHDGNIRPWIAAAERAGATVRWADFDRDSAELPVSAITALLSERTRLVAITAASNLLGTRPDIAAVAAAAHEVGALAYVDAVHLAPHSPIDLGDLGADVLVCSPYKFFGPHLGALVAAPALLETLRPDKLLPSSDTVPERFELGTLPYELLAGVNAAVDFIARLAPGDGERRSRVLASMAAVEEHEGQLFARLVQGLARVDGVTLYGRAECRTPTALFAVRGRSPRQVHEALAARKINAPGGSFYAVEAARWLGLGDAGAVRAGLAPYSNDDDVDRLLDAVTDLGA